MTWRLSEAARAKQDAERSGGEDRIEYDVAPNGVRINREERSAFDAILRQAGLGGVKDNSDRE